MSEHDQINQLSQAELARLVTTIYGIDDDVDAIIERRLARGESADDTTFNSTAQVLAAQIEAFRDGNDFIGYRESTRFANALEALLSDIDELLRPTDLAAALELIERFLALPEVLYNRVDDSDGSLGEVFKIAVRQWLSMAQEVRDGVGYEDRDGRPWVHKILRYFADNGYGVFDNLILQSHGLLTEEELHELASQFESEAQAPAHGTQRDSRTATALHGMESVAEALSDIALYEKSVVLRSPEPNPMQMESIVRFALSIDELARAEHWLAQEQWETDARRHRQLRTLLLQQSGQTELLKDELMTLFRRQPDLNTLQACWQLADSQEHSQLRQQVESLVEPPEDMHVRVSMLILVDSLNKAEQLLVDYHHLVKVYHYSLLAAWIKTFKANGNTLAQIVCYRGLLDDLLGRGYSKAYHHGARYFHKLLALDKTVSNYAGMTDAQSYIRQLQEQHGRKRSFWEQAGYPAKGG